MTKVNGPPSHSKYGWETMTDGSWHLLRSESPNTVGHAQQNQRIKTAAHGWARKHGYRVRTRATWGGAQFYVQFARGMEPFK